MTQTAVSMLRGAVCRVHAASWQPATESWLGDSSSRIELSGQLAGRWLALSGSIQVLDGSAELQLCFLTPAGVVQLPVPTSLKGTLAEVFCIPAGTSQAWLQPLTQPGRFVLDELQWRTLSFWQYQWRLWRRIALFCWRTAKPKRRQAGIDWQLAWRAPAECYRRIGQLRACAPEMDYREWQQRFECLTARQLKTVQQRLPALLGKHRLTLVIVGQKGTSEACWQRSLTSIEQSLGLNAVAVSSLHCLLLATGPEKDAPCRLPRQPCSPDNFQQHLAALDPGQPVLIMPVGVVLAPIALCWWLEVFDASASGWIYSDHDQLDDNGQRTTPHFKPDWSLELARCSHYIGDTLLVKAGVLRQSGWPVANGQGQPPSMQQLVLQLAELPDCSVAHIPAILWHQSSQAAGAMSELRADVVEQHLHRQGIAARVEPNVHGYLDIHYAPASPAPLVSVVIPTRDMLHLLEPCVESVLNRSDYPAVEVLIVDNQSCEPATLDYFTRIVQDARVRVLRYDKPFNYSAINNFAVQQARGELICLLNNDTEVIRPDWLSQMAGQLTQPGVGIVGARLLFADERVQHAGDVIGVGGCASHLHFRLPASAPGYMGRAVLSQDLSAVTAACLLTWRALYLELGGLNETELTVAFNDVDYCLKVREAGWRVLYTPLALLYHYESVSRGKDDNPVKQQRAALEAAYMRARWARQMQGDPFYNPNLNGTAADFRLSAAPRVSKPWQP
ncbi:glycosyltransferase family 2 protein [Alkalimonas amylolytica]|uniref:Glycosyltransferase, GT2 family n=1 Tax=Alkalimonas amylolytica TaxID=152573 RepID=A0A1H3ZZ04_ALKAM|nr:glycosyltransferase family 2 protein [Alkalimonas amylolytica]SEA28867.1 Glycosyltransferase, GT2 family [Alkalimonas amylolytica]